jgi:hypothetical protein
MYISYIIIMLIDYQKSGVFIPYVGGVEHAHVLLQPLETECTVEGTDEGE